MLSPAAAKAALDLLDREDAAERAAKQRQDAEANLSAAQDAMTRMSKDAVREMRRGALARIVEAGAALEAARKAEREAGAALAALGKRDG